MSEALDRRLDVMERIELKLHLLVCTWCERYLLQIKLIRNVVRLHDSKSGKESPKAGLSPEARERMRCSVEALGGPSS